MGGGVGKPYGRTCRPAPVQLAPYLWAGAWGDEAAPLGEPAEPNLHYSPVAIDPEQELVKAPADCARAAKVLFNGLHCLHCLHCMSPLKVRAGSGAGGRLPCLRGRA